MGLAGERQSMSLRAIGDNALPLLEAMIRQAAAAARTADSIANTCIKVSLRHRISRR